MDAKMRLSFVPTAGDYTASARNMSYQDKLAQILLGLAAFMVIAFINSIVRGELGKYIVIWLFTAFIFLTLITIYVIVPAQVGRRAANEPRLIAEQVWAVGEDGILIETPYTEVRLDWYSFKRILDTKTHYIFIYARNPRAYQFLPKRAFASAEQEAEFRRMAARRVAGLKRS
jgi:hypothetical protein